MFPQSGEQLQVEAASAARHAPAPAHQEAGTKERVKPPSAPPSPLQHILHIQPQPQQPESSPALPHGPPCWGTCCVTSAKSQRQLQTLPTPSPGCLSNLLSPPTARDSEAVIQPSPSLVTGSFLPPHPSTSPLAMLLDDRHRKGDHIPTSFKGHLRCDKPRDQFLLLFMSRQQLGICPH